MTGREREDFTSTRERPVAADTSRWIQFALRRSIRGNNRDPSSGSLQLSFVEDVLNTCIRSRKSLWTWFR